MVDVHGPPWLTPRDAIALGKKLEPYNLMFYEDPIAPENYKALGKVAANVSLPIAAGERHAGIHGVRELIEQEIIDVVQPDTGRAGGILQMQKIAHLAEAHHVMVAPHSGSLGPIAEMAAVHLMCTLPNFLILEHLDGDVPQRYTVMKGTPEVTGANAGWLYCIARASSSGALLTLHNVCSVWADGYITVPEVPGLGVDIDVDECAKYPSTGNINQPDAGHGASISLV
jgi:galactonate dehydratase